jgi:ureidoacrylate peracid hydrolase
MREAVMARTQEQLVSIEARPEPVSFDLAKTAVVVVDMQNHFGTPGGTFHNVGVNVQPIRAIVPSIARVLAGAREAGLKVVYLRMPVPARPGHQVLDVGPVLGTPDIRWAAYLDSSIGGVRAAHVAPPPDRPTWNSDIIDGIQPREEDTVVTKKTFGGFHETDLHAVLQARGISNLVFTGCTTSICVETTLREACVRRYNCLALSDCVAEPIGMKYERTNSEATLHVIQTVLGWVTESDAFLQALALGRVAAFAE